MGESSIVSELRIEEREESDHLPVSFSVGNWIEEESKKAGRSSEKYGKDLEEKMIWKRNEKEKYMKMMEERKDEISREGGVQKRWTNMVKIIKETAGKLDMLKKGKVNWRRERKTPAEIRKQKKIVRKSLRNWLRTMKEGEKEIWRSEKIKLNRLKKEKRNEERDKKWREVKESRNMEEFWKAIRGFRPRRKQTGGDISKEQWLNHFKNLLGGEGVESGQSGDGDGVGRVDDEDEVWNREIKVEEVRGVMKRMKNKKAPGEDGIRLEFLKYLPGVWERELAEILNELWNTGELIKGWETANICTIYKAGDENLPSNYRGVALLDTGYKILTNIMASRLKNWAEGKNKIKESQAGFRQGRGTRDHIFVLNSVIGNRLRDKGGKLYAALIDFKTAFDSVDRELMFMKLEKMGVGGKMLTMIKKIYQNTENAVITGEGVTEKFKTKKGVRQGCPLSAFLFIIFIDDIEDKWVLKNEGGTVVGGQKIFGLKFADDVVAVADTAEGMKSMLKDLEKYCEVNKMSMNVKKTKIMIFRRGGRRKKEEFKFNGEVIEIVNEYKYLGYWLSTNNTHAKHVKRVAGKMQKAINAVWGINKRARVDGLKERLQLMDAIIKAGCLYGAEIWGLTGKKEIEKVQGRYVKMSMGLAMNTPDYIWKMEGGRRSLELETRKRVNKYILGVMRMGEERWPQICLKEELRGIQNGQPTKWGKELKAAYESVGDGESLKWMIERKNIQDIREKLETGLERKAEQEEQIMWGGIDRSNYCEEYKHRKKEFGREKYWDDRSVAGCLKEQWARMRCESIGKLTSTWKGFENLKCRLCEEEEEELEHIWGWQGKKLGKN